MNKAKQPLSAKWKYPLWSLEIFFLTCPFQSVFEVIVISCLASLWLYWNLQMSRGLTRGKTNMETSSSFSWLSGVWKQCKWSVSFGPCDSNNKKKELELGSISSVLLDSLWGLSLHDSGEKKFCGEEKYLSFKNIDIWVGFSNLPNISRSLCNRLCIC